MKPLGFILLCIMLISSSKSAAAATPEILVKRLGDRNFSTRTTAERELLELGPVSLEAVLTGTHSENLEIRSRALRLLLELQRMTFEENRELLLQNPWAVPEHSAPGWEKYQLLVGDGLEARELYYNMAFEEMPLIMALQQQPVVWNQHFERRCADLRTYLYQRTQREITPATLAVLLFVVAHEESQPSLAAVQVVTSLVRDPKMSRIVEKSPPLKSLLSHWVTNPRNSTPQNRLDQAAAFDLPGGVEAARELLRIPADRSRTHYQNAIMYLAKHGSVDAIRDLEPLLEDRTLLYPNRSRNARPEQVLVCDVALLALVVLTGQDPAKYSFDPKPDAKYLFGANSGGFPDEETRRQALDRWNHWRSQHPEFQTDENLDASEGALASR